MVKNLLTLAAVAAMAAGSVNAATYELPLDQDLENWGGASYDVATHTITFTQAWNGAGWTFWGEGESDFSAYNAFTLEFEPTDIYVQVFIQTKVPEGETATNVTVGADAGKSSITVPLEPEVACTIGQVMVQNGGVGSVTITRAYFESDFEASPIIWEGEYTASGWNAGAEFPTSLVKVGDILEYTATAGGENTQVLLKGSDWNNLLGSAKIKNDDIIDGVVEVVVTEQMIAAAGGKIFLQGDGGMTFTQVEKIGEMEVEDGFQTINAGMRAFPVEIYATIPADATALYVIFDGQPEWVQVCNSSWTNLVDNEAATIVDEEDGLCLMSFPLTAEIISDLNSNQQIILNGGGALYSGAFIKSETDGIEAIESVDTDAPAVYYNLQGIQISNPVAGQMYIVKQGNQVSKIIK